MTMTEYLSDRLGTIVLQAVFAAAAAGFLYATGTGSGVILLLAIFWLLVFPGTCAVGFIKCRTRLRELENIMNGLDEKYLFTECIPRGGSAYERRLLELIRRAGRSMTGAVSDARAAQREYREYVESWVHEIKTPMTAAGLICRNTDPVTRRKLASELAQIEAHVERALFYARAESPEKDFIIRRIPLEEIVDAAVERHRTLLIQSGVALNVLADCTHGTGRGQEHRERENVLTGGLMPHGEEPSEKLTGWRSEYREDGLSGTSEACKTDRGSESGRDTGWEQIVYTDDKWAVFILGQLLQNAARYRKEASEGCAGGENAPVIILSARQLGRQVQLIVSDNGTGIPAHELSRVFDRGFTGSNGRKRGGSTGMGLYLCRRLGACLEIGLQIASKEGEGTTVTLTFPALSK